MMVGAAAAVAWCAIAAVPLLLIIGFYERMWWRPRRVEAYLRKQGLVGSEYRFMSGDLKMITASAKQSNSTPINLTHDVVPRVVPWIHQSINNYGKNFYLWFGAIPRIHITQSEHVKEILNKPQLFQKTKPNPLVKLLVTGLAVHEGEKWRKHKRIISPAFHLDKLKHMVPAFYLSCSETIAKWESMVSSNGGSCELNVMIDLEALICDAISRTAFGSSYQEGIKIFQLQKQLIFLAIQAALSLYIPGWRFVPTKHNRRMKELAKEIQVSVTEIIDKKSKAIKESETRDPDLLTILLESNMKEIEQHGSRKMGLSIDDVIEECKLFYFGGHETTSDLLAWTMICLSMHQEWQVKARDEVLQAFGNDKPNFNGLNHLKIVTMILYEVLRLYPPVVAMTRDVTKETRLGDMSLPAGVQVTIPLIVMQHDVELWGDDANEFNPSRFAEGISKATKNQAAAFLPFSNGPRTCIGQNFAMLEVKMALTMILRRFSFELSPSYAHAPYTTITLQPQHGAHLILRCV